MWRSTATYDSRVGGFGWRLLRLATANVAFALRASAWLATEKVEHG
jgi:hypothetical protein